MNLSVLGGRVLVKAESQQESRTASGLVTVEDYAPDVIGTVVACADGLDVHPNDIVIFSPSAGQLMDYGGDRYLVLTHDEILAVVE